jgi:hypothetical protein
MLATAKSGCASAPINVISGATILISYASEVGLPIFFRMLVSLHLLLIAPNGIEILAIYCAMRLVILLLKGNEGCYKV